MGQQGPERVNICHEHLQLLFVLSLGGARGMMKANFETSLSHFAMIPAPPAPSVVGKCSHARSLLLSGFGVGGSCTVCSSLRRCPVLCVHLSSCLLLPAFSSAKGSRACCIFWSCYLIPSSSPAPEPCGKSARAKTGFCGSAAVFRAACVVAFALGQLLCFRLFSLASRVWPRFAPGCRTSCGLAPYSQARRHGLHSPSHALSTALSCLAAASRCPSSSTSVRRVSSPPHHSLPSSSSSSSFHVPVPLLLQLLFPSQQQSSFLLPLPPLSYSPPPPVPSSLPFPNTFLTSSAFPHSFSSSHFLTSSTSTHPFFLLPLMPTFHSSFHEFRHRFLDSFLFLFFLNPLILLFQRVMPSNIASTISSPSLSNLCLSSTFFQISITLLSSSTSFLFSSCLASASFPFQSCPVRRLLKSRIDQHRQFLPLSLQFLHIHLPTISLSTFRLFHLSLLVHFPLFRFFSFS